MKYFIDKNVRVSRTDRIVEITNLLYNNKIELEGLSSELFEMISNKVDSSDIINYIEKFNNSEVSNQTVFNSLIYVLLREKIIYCNNEYITKSGVKIFIKESQFELTDCCNYRCPHCYVDKKYMNFLSIDLIKNIALELKKMNCQHISLSGGEIFSISNFVEIYEFLYTQGFIISLNSNGSLLNDELLNILKKYPPYVIEISLYGYDDETYKNFTGKDAQYDKIINNIIKLRDSGIYIKLKNVITNSNKNFFSKIQNKANQLNIPFKSDFLSFPKICKKSSFNPEQISPMDSIEYLSRQPNIEEYYINLFNNRIIDNYIFKCKKNDDSIFVNCKGKISMCACLQNVSYAYKPNSLEKIILENRKILTKKFKKSSKCNSCNLISICRYCPAKFYLTTKKYTIPPEWYCEFGKRAYEKFIKGYRFIRKSYLTDSELSKIYNILSFNMKKIGFNVLDSEYENWKTSFKNSLQESNEWCYIIYKDGNICGYIEINDVNNKFYISEIEIDERYQKSKLILELIKFLIKNKDFLQYDNFYYSVNKKNVISFKTFEHLGGIKIRETETKYFYEISRNDVTKYLKSLKRFS